MHYLQPRGRENYDASEAAECAKLAVERWPFREVRTAFFTDADGK